MADKKKVTKKAPVAKKVSKKVAKKVTKKAAPAKKAVRKVTKKVTKKVPAAKKKTAAAKKTIRKVAKKVTKKATKKPVTKKRTAKKSTAKKSTAKKSTAKKVTQEAESRFEQLQGLLQDNLSDMNAEKAEALAKSIWLAGLGTYSRTFDEISERTEDLQDRVESINVEGQKLFEDMVKRGKSMQADAEKVVQQGRDTLEDRVEELKKRFGGGLSSFIDIPTRLRDAAEKIEEISDRLNKKK